MKNCITFFCRRHFINQEHLALFRIKLFILYVLTKIIMWIDINHTTDRDISGCEVHIEACEARELNTSPKIQSFFGTQGSQKIIIKDLRKLSLRSKVQKLVHSLIQLHTQRTKSVIHHYTNNIIIHHYVVWRNIISRTKHEGSTVNVNQNI